MTSFDDPRPRPALAAVLSLALALAVVAAREPARSTVAEGPIARSFRNENLLREEERKVGRPLPGLADPLESERIVASFEHAELNALSADADFEPTLPDPEEYVDDDDGFITVSGTLVDLSRRADLRAEIPDVTTLYFDDDPEGRFEDESDPAPPPMNYTLLDEVIETRERMTSRVGSAPGAPEPETAAEERRIDQYLDEREKPVLRISKKLEKTIKRGDDRGARKGRDEEEEEVEPVVLRPRSSRSDAFRWPVVAKRISSRFGWRIHPIRRRKKFHNGVDLAANYGRPIVAAADGVVDYAGWKSYYGKTVIIRHPNGLKTLYAHCSKLDVARGQRVSGGKRIAAIGSTGLSTGPHLHFSVMKAGQFVNPLPYLK